jgi:hypothetical protein
MKRDSRIRLARRASSFLELQGLSHAARSGSRGIVAADLALSSGAEAPEAPLPRLDERAFEPCAGDVELGHDLAVDLHRALRD